MSLRLSEAFVLPEGAIPNGAIAVCQYLDTDGEMKFGIVSDMGELPLSSAVGLLEMAKLHLHRVWLEDDEGED